MNVFNWEHIVDIEINALPFLADPIERNRHYICPSRLSVEHAIDLKQSMQISAKVRGFKWPDDEWFDTLRDMLSSGF